MKNTKQLSAQLKTKLQKQPLNASTGRMELTQQNSTVKTLTTSGLTCIRSFARVFGLSWEREHGQGKDPALIGFMNSLNEIEMRRILQHAVDTKARGKFLDLSLFQLLVWKDEPTDNEWSTIMSRVISGSQLNDRVEQYLHENILWNLKRQNAGKELNFLKQEYHVARAKEKNGTLKLKSDELLALPTTSIKNLNDIHREKYDGKLNPRVAQILKEGKNHES